MNNLIYGVTAFLGAYLLFTVQPMVGKFILPVFGGGSNVWTTIMLFFTTILLLGYGYVVWLVKKTKGQQMLWYSIVVFVSLAWLVFLLLGKYSLYFGLNQSFFNNMPVLALLVLLVMTLGLPSFLLASTSAILQYWYAHSTEKKSPYWLYILSNLGSLVGLLAYPFITEPLVKMENQRIFWVLGFIVYGLFMFVVTLFVRRRLKIPNKQTKPLKVSLGVKLAWFIFPFVSTAAMLAFTAQMTQVASTLPFIWVATLGVYLLSFIIAFTPGNWYPKGFYEILLIGFVGVLGGISSGFIKLGLYSSFFFTLITLFIIDLVCHRELFQKRPEPAGLTIYYLMISLGGAAASLFIAVIAPNIFPDFWEYPLILLISIVCGVFILFKNSKISLRIHTVTFAVIVIALILWQFISYFQGTLKGDKNSKVIVSLRNFYGVHKVIKIGVNKPYVLELRNARTTHGRQIIGTSDESQPLNFYTYGSEFGQTILNHPKKLAKSPVRIGVVGLGAGMIAAYCGAGDTIRFYEINPQVIQISREYFTYISNAQKAGCNIEIVQGDARVSMENELKSGLGGQFDVLVVDAFTDITIPIHLLTSEAVQVYSRHISDGGLIMLHTVSPIYNFAPMLKSVAATVKLYFREVVDSKGDRWVIMSKISGGQQSSIPMLEDSSKPPWTDSFSNILDILN